MASYDLTSGKTGRTYKVEFDDDPTPEDVDFAIDYFDSQPVAEEQPGYLSQLGTALSTGTASALASGRAAFNVLTGDTEDTATAIADLAAAQREAQAAQTPEDIAFMADLQQQARELEAAEGILPTLREAVDLPLAALRQPGAALKTAVQSLPNVLVSTPVTIGAGLAGAAIGSAAGLPTTGPGALVTGALGAAAGGALANTALEVGPAVFDILNERTNGAAANWTREQILEALKADPTIVEEGLKRGATRGAVIGATEAIGLGAGSRLAGASGRAVQQATRRALVEQGVDLADDVAVRAGVQLPAVQAAREAAQAGFTRAGEVARVAGGAGIETAASGAGEALAQLATGEDVDTADVFLEMLGESVASVPTVLAGQVLGRDPVVRATAANVQRAEDVMGEAFPNVDELEAQVGREAADAVAQAVVDAGVPVGQPTDLQSGLTDLGTIEGDLLQFVPPQPVSEPTPITTVEPLPAVEAEAPAAVETQAQLEPQATQDEIQITEAGGLPPVESQPVDQTPAVEAPEGAALGSGQGQEGQVTPEPVQPPQAAPAPIKASELEIGDTFQIGDRIYQLGSKLRDGRLRATQLDPTTFEPLPTPAGYAAGTGVVIPKNRNVNRVQRPLPAPQAEVVSPEGVTPPQPLPPTGGVPTESLPAGQPTSGDVGTSLRAVATNTVTPEQVASLEAQGLARTVQGQHVITDAGLALMPEAERPRLTEAERVAEIEGQGGIMASLRDMDAPYLDAVARGDMETAQRLVDEAARAAGYNRKGVRFGYYVDGVPLPPSRNVELNFGPGYYVAENATLDTTTAAAVSVSPKVNKSDLERLGLDPDRVEFRRDAVFVKAARPFRSEYGTNAEPETVAFINAQLAYDSAVQEANRRLGLPFEATSYRKTVADLIAQGRIPFDSVRGTTGRVGMSSELVVQNPSQIKSAAPVTYDNNGEVIPLSQRFQSESPDIRFSIRNTPPANVQPSIRPLQGDQQRNETLARRKRPRPSSPTVLRARDGQPLPNIRVTADNAAKARDKESRQVPGASETWVGTTEQFLAEFPGSKAAQAVEGNTAIEAFYDSATDRAVVLTDRVQVLEGDARRAVRNGTSAAEEAVRRLIRHESFVHRGWRALPSDLRSQFLALSNSVVSAEDLDTLAKTYRRYANWRDDPSIKALVFEEWLAQRIERIEKLPAAADGPLAQVKEWLGRVWQWLTGDDSLEATPTELGQVMRLMVRALETGEKEVAVDAVMASLTDTDAAYMDAVARGDMETAQRLVDEAARAAGYNVGPVFHGTSRAKTQNAGFDQWPPVRLDSQIEPGVFVTPNITYAKFYSGEVWPQSIRQFLTGDTTRLREPTQMEQRLLEQEDPKVFKLYARVRNPVEVDSIQERRALGTLKSLQDRGVDAVVVKNIETVLTDPSQIKSADPVTYDDSGNVIPLSQRFQPESPDIRFSLTQDPNADTLRRIVSEATPTEAMKTSKAREFTMRANTLTEDEKEFMDAPVANLDYYTQSVENAKQGAIKFVDAMGPVGEWGQKLLSPEWREAMNLKIDSYLYPFVLAEALNRSGGIVDPRTTEGVARVRSNEIIAGLFSGIRTASGQSLNAMAKIMADPRYAPMFVVQAARDMTNKTAATVVDPQTNVPAATDAVRQGDEQARQQATDDLAEELRLRDLIYDMGIAAQDAGIAERIRRINDNVFRLGVIERMRAAMAASGVAPSMVTASRAAVEQQYEGFTLEQLEAEAARLRDEIRQDVAAVEQAAKAAPRKGRKGSDPASQAKALIDKLEASPQVPKKPKPNPVRDLYREHLKTPMGQSEFVNGLVELGVTAEDAQKLYDLAAIKIAAAQATNTQAKLSRYLSNEGSALASALNNIRSKTEGAPTWQQLFNQPFETQRQWRQRFYEALRADPALANLTPQETRDLAAALDKVWNDKRERNLQSILKRANLPGTKEKTKQKIAESVPLLLRYLNTGVFNDDSFRAAVAKKFGAKVLGADDLARISTLAQEAQAPGITQPERNQKLFEMVKIIQQGAGVELGEVISNYWVTAVLSGFRTQFDMALSSLNGLRVMAQTAADVAIRRRDFKMVGQAAKNYFKTMANAILESANYFVTGDPTLLDGYQYTMNQFLQEGIAASNPFDYFEQVIKDPRVAGWRKITPYFFAGIQRAMRIWDHVNSTSVKEGMLPLAMALNQEKYRDARMPSAEDVAQARQKALAIVGGDKTYREKRAITAYTRQILNDVLESQYPGLLDEAREVGFISAYQNDPTGLGGIIYHTLLGVTKKFVNAAGKFRDEGVAARENSEWSEARKITDRFMRAALYILASNARNFTGTRFVRFVGNRVNELISFTPVVGLTRLAEKDMTESKKSMIYTNQVVGGIISLWVIASMMRAMEDEEDEEKRGWNVEGSWANLTPTQKNQRRAEGRIPYSLKIGDTNFNYNAWPMASLFATVGNLYDMKRYRPDKWNEKDVLDKTLSSLWAGGTSIMDLSSISGLMDLLGRSAYSTDPVEGAKQWAAKFSANYVGGFIPRALKDLDMVFDPEARKPDNLFGYFAKEIPFYRRTEAAGEKLYDIFGEPVQMRREPWSRSFSQDKLEPEYNLLGDLNERGIFLSPANPDNRTVGSGANRRELTKAEAEAYMMETGKLYKDYVLQQGERLKELDFETAKEKVSRDTERLRNAALRRAISTAN